MADPKLPAQGTFAGRVWRPGIGPCVVTIRDGRVLDITAKGLATLRDLLESAAPARIAQEAEGTDLGPVTDLFDASSETSGPDDLRLLAPPDLQAIKACGVTFAGSMVERVIEEQAAGDPAKALEIRARVGAVIGDSLADHQALSRGTPAERWVVPSDYMFVYENRTHFLADGFGWALRRDLGFEWSELEGNAFRAYDPVFDPRLGYGVKLANHGRISDPGQYVKDLAKHIQQQGGRLVIGDVSDIAHENGKVSGVRVSGQTIACDAAVIATGVWSGPLSRKLGLAVPLESERGYHIEFWNPSVVPRSPVMVASGKFVATPMEGRLRLAGVVEFGGLDAGPSRAPFDLLKRQGLAAFPGLEYSEMTEWMGHRPAPADSIPVIGEVPGIAGVFTGFGHHHVGLTGGPKTGRLIAQMIGGHRPNIDMTPYAPARFAAAGKR